MREMRCSQKVDFLKNAKLGVVPWTPCCPCWPNFSLNIFEIRCLVDPVLGLVDENSKFRQNGPLELPFERMPTLAYIGSKVDFGRFWSI